MLLGGDFGVREGYHVILVLHLDRQDGEWGEFRLT